MSVPIVSAQMTLWCYIAFTMGLVTTINTFAVQALRRLRACGCKAPAGSTRDLHILIQIAMIDVVRSCRLAPHQPRVLSSDRFASIGIPKAGAEPQGTSELRCTESAGSTMWAVRVPIVSESSHRERFA